MIRTLKISAAVAIAGAFSVAQGATCTEQSFGAITIKPSSKDNSKCIATIDATGEHRNEPINITETISVDTVYYSRTDVESQKNQTIVLPFAVKKGCGADGAKFRKITKIAYSINDKVWKARTEEISSVSEQGLAANTPYLFAFSNTQQKTGQIKFYGQDCTFDLNTSEGASEIVYPTDVSGDLTGYWSLKGVYETKTWNSETERQASYGFVSKTDDKHHIGDFVKAGPNASVPPMRAYLVYNSQGTLAKAAPGLSFAPAAEVLPASISVVMMSAEEPDDDVPATEECFQDGDGIFEVKDIHLKNETGTPVLNDEGNPIYDTDGNQVLSYDDIIVRTACIDGKSDARMKTLSISQNIEVDSIAYNRTFAIGSGWNNPAVASTIVLPFTVSENQCISNAVFYDILNIRNWGQEDNLTWQIMVEQRDNSKPLIPNHPYIVLANDTNIIFNRAISGGFKKCAYNITYSNVLEDTVFSNVDGLPGTWTFKGTYEKITFNESTKKGVYGFVAKQDTVDGKVFSAGQFVKAGTGASVPPMRAYLKYNAAGALAKGAASTGIAEEDLPETIVVKFLNTDGEVTAIGQMNTTTGEISMDENKWFDMKGRMMNKKPTVKGTYYNKGQKVIIK